MEGKWKKHWNATTDYRLHALHNAYTYSLFLRTKSARYDLLPSNQNSGDTEVHVYTKRNSARDKTTLTDVATTG